jgi:two-component system LytT family response regulator
VYRLILIDDFECKKELNSFILRNKKSIRAVLPVSVLNFTTRIVVNTNSGTHVLKINEIMYFELKHKKSFKLHINNRPVLLIPLNFNSFQKQIPDNLFVRVHQSYLININYVDQYIKSSSNIILKNGVHLPVSVRKKDLLLKKLNTLQF